MKLFRKIRQKLLIKNKFGNYLVYAIGEIILVIIGILMALAINEHSKNKNNLALRDLYIIQLSDEVDHNLKELTALENGAQEMLNELDTLAQLLENKEFNNPKLSLKSFVLISSNKFYPIMVTYENLKFSGDLKLFDDLNLRNSISETYETFNPIDRFESLEKDVIEAFYENFLMPNVRFKYMGNPSGNHLKEIYFENMVLSRIVTITQNRDAYANSIKSLHRLKNTFAELNTN
jgi:hypothetical protein